MVTTRVKNHNSWLWASFILALLVRIGYIFIGSRFSAQSSFYLTGDSASYALSIINLLEKGIYSFDFGNPDAAFGRLPGYPLFWGVHYLVFKSKAYIAVAITQAVLDSSIVFLLFSIIRKLSDSSQAALAGSFLYATYIFTVFWVPVTGTESLGVFITVLFVYIASKERYQSSGWYLALGLCAAAAFYIREYLGILFLIAGIYLFADVLKRKIPFRFLALYSGIFILLYSFWPVRNYLSYNRIEFLKPPTAGYDRYGKDVASFRGWMYTWNTDIEPYMTRILDRNSPAFPENVIKDSNEQIYINRLLDTAMDCGSSFNVWKKEAQHIAMPCNTFVANGFDSLRKEYIARDPITYFIKVPALNLKKAFFKSSLNKPSPNAAIRLLTSVLFGWRTVWVILGFAGMLFYCRSFTGFILTCFPVFMYVFICCVMRQVEMRYLLQADVCLLSLGVCFFYYIYKRKLDGSLQIKKKE